MKLFSGAPFVRLLISFLIGITLGLYMPDFPHSLLVCTVLAIITVFYVIFQRRLHTYHYRWVPGILMNLFLLSCGYFITIHNNEILNKKHYTHYLSDAKSSQLLVMLGEPVHEKPKTAKVLVRVKCVYNKNEVYETSGNLLLYLPKDSTALQLKYGDHLLINSSIDTIAPPLNPYEFDYKQYLFHKNIHRQSFVKQGEWIKTNLVGGNWLIKASYRLRQLLLNSFSKYLSANEYAIAASLIAGYVDNIDLELISAYRNTGVLHVLSVSGMHVGIIYLAFSFLFSLLPFKKRFKYLEPALSIIFIWFYALLTGLSPAVLRAATMLTFIIVGKASNRDVNTYNSLAVSAFVLLFVNPYLITDAGFQLSYLAIIGLVALQPIIYNYWEPRSIWIDRVWMLTSTTIAAQLATMPLSLYYFHQFPNYFIPANLVVAPLSTLAMYSGITLGITASIGFVGLLVGKVTSISVWLLNTSVFFIDKLPFSNLSEIRISALQAIAFYAVIIALFMFLQQKRIKALYVCLFSFTLFLSIYNYQTFQTHKQHKLIIYNTPKASTIDFISNNIAYSIITGDSSKTQRYISENRIWLGVHAIQNIDSSYQNNELYVNKGFVQFKDKKLLIIDGKQSIQTFTKPIAVDIIFLKNNPKLDLTELYNNTHCKTIVVDASNSRKIQEKLEQICPTYITLHNTTKKGAFVLDLLEPNLQL